MGRPSRRRLAVNPLFGQRDQGSRRKLGRGSGGESGKAPRPGSVAGPEPWPTGSKDVADGGG